MIYVNRKACGNFMTKHIYSKILLLNACQHLDSFGVSIVSPHAFVAISYIFLAEVISNNIVCSAADHNVEAKAIIVKPPMIFLYCSLLIFEKNENQNLNKKYVVYFNILYMV